MSDTHEAMKRRYRAHDGDNWLGVMTWLEMPTQHPGHRWAVTIHIRRGVAR